MGNVQFGVGPVDAAAARTWLDNSKRIIAAVRANPAKVPFIVEQPLLELVEALLEVWADAAEGVDVFHWTANVDVANIETLTQQWRLLARLDDGTLERLGVRWAPEEAHAFFDALVIGVAAALRQDERTTHLADEVAARPPGEDV